MKHKARVLRQTKTEIVIKAPVKHEIKNGTEIIVETQDDIYKMRRLWFAIIKHLLEIDFYNMPAYWQKCFDLNDSKKINVDKMHTLLKITCEWYNIYTTPIGDKIPVAKSISDGKISKKNMVELLTRLFAYVIIEMPDVHLDEYESDKKELLK